MIPRITLIVISILFVGCASTINPQPDNTVEGQYRINPERTELLVAVPQKEVAYYFNNNADRLCYTYKIPGKWRSSGQSGLLRSEDGQAYAGIFLYSAKELEEFEGPDLVTRAARLLTRSYEKRLGLSIDRESLVPFKSQQSGTIKWSISWPRERGGQYRASKIFVEIAPRWVAQITVTGAADEDALARHILETLNSTSDPECYWPFIRKNFPNLQ